MYCQWQLNFKSKNANFVFCVNISLFLCLVPSQCNLIHISVIWNLRQMRENKVKVSQMCWVRNTVRKKSERC